MQRPRDPWIEAPIGREGSPQDERTIDRAIVGTPRPAERQPLLMSHRRKPVASAGAPPVTLLRRRYGLSQQEAADRLGLSIGHLRLLEMQSRRLWTADLKMIERYFARSVKGAGA